MFKMLQVVCRQLRNTYRWPMQTNSRNTTKVFKNIIKSQRILLLETIEFSKVIWIDAGKLHRSHKLVHLSWDGQLKYNRPWYFVSAPKK